MKYEIAKELKEKGFPLACTSYTTENYVFGLVVKNGESIMYPLLDELIEACGDNLSYLKRMEVFNVTWEAACNKMPGIKVYEPTPEDAVARLWLSLN
jgi:hypothetical protein